MGSTKEWDEKKVKKKHFLFGNKHSKHWETK